MKTRNTRLSNPRSSLVSSWVNLDFAEILHGLAPEFLESFRQTIREFAISDKQRRESTFLDERMVQGQHHGLIVHDVKRVLVLRWRILRVAQDDARLSRHRQGNRLVSHDTGRVHVHASNRPNVEHERKLRPLARPWHLSRTK